jgi:retron-type reverse transcriptase
MKRIGGLWPELISWKNLEGALHRAARGKRKRPDVAEFLLNWEPRLIELQRQLQSGEYLPGGYRTFAVREPKPRLISAAPFRDRVVHHALTQILEPIFERRFASQSYASRTGFGNHEALAAAAGACRRFPFVLQCDIRKYFPSVDHEILKGLLGRALKCPDTLKLAGLIIDGSNPQEPAEAYFPGDDLFTPSERWRGLPLGNQTSQFFANVYLNELDQFVLREVRPGAYCRYVDDFLLFGANADLLAEARCTIESKLNSLRLRLHEGKSRSHCTASGITFLGWRIFPDHRRLVRGNVVRFRRRIRALQRRFGAGEAGWDEVLARLQSWNAHAAHGDTWRLREQIFSQFPFCAGEIDLDSTEAGAD